MKLFPDSMPRRSIVRFTVVLLINAILFFSLPQWWPEEAIIPRSIAFGAYAGMFVFFTYMLIKAVNIYRAIDEARAAKRPHQTPEQLALTNRVLAWLDAGGDEQLGFNMEYYVWHGSCGTTCCTAGAILAFKDGGYRGYSKLRETYLQINNGIEPISVQAGKLIGMNATDSYRMFTRWDITKPRDYTHAAERLRHWQATGEVIL